MEGEATVCQLCREPIWNFLCIDCLSKDIGKWLPQEYAEQFKEFHSTIKKYIHTTPDNFEPCLTCSLLNESPFCPHCYTHEVYHWIREVNFDLARNFSKIFFFYKFEGSEFLKSDAEPISQTINKRPLAGLCDSCLEYSEGLEEDNRGWVCEVCND